MKETKDPIKVNVSTFLLIIAMIIIGVMAYFMYSQKMQSDKEIANLQDEAKKSQATINELQGKVVATTETSNIEESSKETSASTSNENQFNTYQSNFEKTYKSVVAKYEGKPGNEGEIKTDQMANIPSKGGVTVKSNGDAYYKENQKIDSNVASVHYCPVGQDSGDVVLIHRDGTVSIIKDALYPDTAIKTQKIEKAKNIVSVLQVFEYDDMDGGDTYYLVDINGNIIDVK